MDILHALPCGVLSFRDDGEIVLTNDPLRTMLGYGPGELEGQHVEALFSLGTRIFYQTHFFPLIKLHGRAEEVYLVLRSSSGEDIGVLANAAREEGDDDIVNHCVFMRVRERKKFEEELLRAKKAAEEALRRNEELYEDARQARAEAERANHAKSSFLAAMSHEIRTPINAIIGYTELLEMEVQGALTERQREFVRRARAGSDHLLRLVTDVLDLSKIESGGMTVRNEPNPLAGEVEAALEMVEGRAEAAGVRLVGACKGAEHRYLGDPDRLRQILLNLLSNAVKFTDPGGAVTVTCGLAERTAGTGDPPEGPWLFVSVEDSGIGIPEEAQESIFEPFVQVDSGPRRRTGGTGLGLPISRRLARLMGGDLDVRSEPGRGSTFTLWLRAAPAPGGDAVAAAPEPGPGRPT